MHVLNWDVYWPPKTACRELCCQLNCLENDSTGEKFLWTFYVVLFPLASRSRSRCCHFLLAKVTSKLLRCVK